MPLRLDGESRFSRRFLPELETASEARHSKRIEPPTRYRAGNPLPALAVFLSRQIESSDGDGRQIPP
jgi:hypothetical protein